MGSCEAKPLVTISYPLNPSGQCEGATRGVLKTGCQKLKCPLLENRKVDTFGELHFKAATTDEVSVQVADRWTLLNKECEALQNTKIESDLQIE